MMKENSQPRPDLPQKRDALVKHRSKAYYGLEEYHRELSRGLQSPEELLTIVEEHVDAVIIIEDDLAIKNSGDNSTSFSGT